MCILCVAYIMHTANIMIRTVECYFKPSNAQDLSAMWSKSTKAILPLPRPTSFFTIHSSLHAFWEVVERNAIQALMGEEKPSADKGNQEQMGNYLAT